MKPSNADIFIEKYKELEQAVRAEYHLSDGDSISYYLGHKTKYKKIPGGHSLLSAGKKLLRTQRQGPDRGKPGICRPAVRQYA